MYIAVHRVTSNMLRHDGINAFLYHHGGLIWRGWPRFLPETNPGTLQLQSVEVRPGNNPVRSYLDILTPDDTRPDDLLSSYRRLMESEMYLRAPQGILIGSCWFRHDLEMSLYRWLDREMSVLFLHAYRILRSFAPHP